MPNGVPSILGIPILGAGTLPQVMQQQRQEQQQAALSQSETLKNLAAAQVAAQKEDPFTQADSAQLVKDTTAANANAADASEKDIPLYTQLKAALAHVPLGTGPLKGQLLWATPEGQFFKSLLTRAQGNYVKNFHLGRMTQLEFNLLRSAVGGKTTFAPALNKLFDRQLHQDNQTLIKANFYNQYVGSGGRSSIEASNRWLQHLGQTESQTTQPKTQDTVTKTAIPAAQESAQQFFSSKLKKNVSLSDLQDTARIHKTTVDDIKKQLGIE